MFSNLHVPISSLSTLQYRSNNQLSIKNRLVDQNKRLVFLYFRSTSSYTSLGHTVYAYYCLILTKQNNNSYYYEANKGMYLLCAMCCIYVVSSWTFIAFWNFQINHLSMYLY